MTRLLVAGAAGFIGSHVVAAALARGLSVAALVRDRRPHAAPNLDVVRADLVADDLVPTLAAVRPEIVVNAASYGVGADERDADRMFAINTLGAFRLHAAARAAGVRRFIQLGSYSEYGDHSGTITEDTPLRPKDAYGATKAAASLLVAVPDTAPEALVLRLFNVWGPGERPHRLLMRVIDHCRRGQRLPLTSGDQMKDWTFVGDLAGWIVEIALRSDAYPFRIVNVASGLRLSVRDLALAAAERLGGAHLLDFGAVPIPPREVQTGPADTTRLDILLPNRRTTPLAEAIARTLAVGEP